MVPQSEVRLYCCSISADLNVFRNIFILNSKDIFYNERFDGDLKTLTSNHVLIEPNDGNINSCIEFLNNQFNKKEFCTTKTSTIESLITITEKTSCNSILWITDGKSIENSINIISSKVDETVSNLLRKDAPIDQEGLNHEKQRIKGTPDNYLNDEVKILYEELEKSNRIYDTLKFIEDYMQKGTMNDTTTKKNETIEREIDMENISSERWIELNGIKARSLGIYNVLKPISFRHCDGILDFRNRHKYTPIKRYDTVYKTNDDFDKVVFINALYCNGKFPHIEWMDGSIVHVNVTEEIYKEYDRKLEALFKSINQRMRWLQHGSRELFGTITESNVYILIDVSTSMTNKIKFVKKKLRQLMMEQIVHVEKFNLIIFGSNMCLWSKHMITVDDTSLESALDWINNIECYGTTNIMDTLKRTLCDQEVHGIYLLTDGRPNIPMHHIISFIEDFYKNSYPAGIHTEKITVQNKKYYKPVIHTISFNMDDKEAIRFLLDLSKISGGRFHSFNFNLPGLYQIKERWKSHDYMILENEIEKGKHFLNLINQIKNECINQNQVIVKNTKDESNYIKNYDNLKNGNELHQNQLNCRKKYNSLPDLHNINESQLYRNQKSLLSKSTQNVYFSSSTDEINGKYLCMWLWVRKFGLEANKMTIEQILVNGSIDHKPKYVPILNKNVCAKVYKNILPVAYKTFDESKTNLTLVNPQCICIKSYEKEINATIIDMKAVFNFFLWNVYMSKSECNYMENHDIIEPKLPIHFNRKNSNFNKFLRLIMKDQNIMIDPYDRSIIKAIKLKIYSRLDKNESEYSTLTNQSKQNFDFWHCGDRTDAFKVLLDKNNKRFKSINQSNELKSIWRSELTIVKNEIKFGKKNLKNLKKLYYKCINETSQSKYKPLNDTNMNKPKIPKRLMHTGSAKGGRVIARNYYDGYFYCGRISKLLAPNHYMVKFDQLLASREVPIDSVINIGGSSSRPRPDKDDCVLALIKNGENNFMCYVPGVVLNIDHDSGNADRYTSFKIKKYQVTLFNGQMEYFDINNLIKIHKLRYNSFVKFIASLDKIDTRNFKMVKCTDRNKLFASNFNNLLCAQIKLNEKSQKEILDSNTVKLIDSESYDSIRSKYLAVSPRLLQTSEMELGMIEKENEIKYNYVVDKPVHSDSFICCSVQSDTEGSKKDEYKASHKKIKSLHNDHSFKNSTSISDKLDTLETSHSSIGSSICDKSELLKHQNTEDTESHSRSIALNETYSTSKFNSIDQLSKCSNASIYHTDQEKSPRYKMNESVYVRNKNDGFFYLETIVKCLDNQRLYFVKSKSNVLFLVSEYDMIHSNMSALNYYHNNNLTKFKTLNKIPVIAPYCHFHNFLAPGVIKSLSHEKNNLSAKIKYFDGSNRIELLKNIFILKDSHYQPVVEYIQKCLFSNIGQTAIAWRENKRCFDIGIITKQLEKYQMNYLVEWSDYKTDIITNLYFFIASANAMYIRLGDYVLAPINAKKTQYSIAKIVKINTFDADQITVNFSHMNKRY
ncbi:hypothetical protein A3Q56_02638 [Intoshia linei]|uniref:VWFA domain-containing protein n=1 Tax=Intoshia linei TaxID=1819745 RepID=A0A177B763_9BILA|nr:hypothetical protein A3Q56_02638 [Intoshia linei]